MVLLTKYAIEEMDVLPQSGGDDRLCQSKTSLGDNKSIVMPILKLLIKT